MDADDLRHLLLPGERLLWTGRPRQGLCLSPPDVLLIPFSLLWGGFAIVWETMVLRSRAPVLFALWGIPFVLVGLYLIAGRFFADAYLRGVTSYAVTDQRILIIRRGWLPKMVTLAIERLPALTLSPGAGGRGTIEFGNPPAGFGRPGIASVTPSLDRTPRFFGIEDAGRVFALVQQSSRAPTPFH